MVLPPLDPQGLPGMAHLGPKYYLQVFSEKLKQLRPPWEICASTNEFSSKKETFIEKMMRFYPPQDPQGLPDMANLGFKSYPQVSSEKLKKNMTSMGNRCLII